MLCSLWFDCKAADGSTPAVFASQLGLHQLNCLAHDCTHSQQHRRHARQPQAPANVGPAAAAPAASNPQQVPPAGSTLQRAHLQPATPAMCGGQQIGEQARDEPDEEARPSTAALLQASSAVQQQEQQQQDAQQACELAAPQATQPAACDEAGQHAACKAAAAGDAAPAPHLGASSNAGSDTVSAAAEHACRAAVPAAMAVAAAARGTAGWRLPAQLVAGAELAQLARTMLALALLVVLLVALLLGARRSAMLPACAGLLASGLLAARQAPSWRRHGHAAVRGWLAALASLPCVTRLRLPVAQDRLTLLFSDGTLEAEYCRVRAGWAGCSAHLPAALQQVFAQLLTASHC